MKKFILSKLELRKDDAENEDQFKEKTHELVASSLVKLITEHKGGFAIGLEGSWGSGKSTVAKITEQKILESNKHKDEFVFFTFDTWAHQGDPIRRSFLECLAGTLNKNKIINNKKWARLVNQIKAQQSKTVTTTSPDLPVYNYIMAFYALLAPIVFFYAHFLIRDNRLTEALGYTSVFVAIILLTSLLTYLIRNACNLKTRNLPVLPSYRYLNHEVKSENHVENIDATTIEFNSHFDELINYLSNRHKKLVVILDNLDRVSSDDFISMWGTMRNFFTAEEGSKREEILRHVFLIVPFDQAHVNNIFKVSDYSGKKYDPEIGEEFVDKTFRLVLDVAQPINTNWKAFFNHEIKNAFGEQLTEKQLHELQKLFDIHYQENDVSITPRKIKKFINDLILQVYERNGEIPLKYLALYVLNKNKIKNNPSGIVTGEIGGERTKAYLVGEDWAQNVAATHYKVSPKNALQLVLENRISNALLNNKIEEIKEMQEYTGFKDALTKVVEENVSDWAKTETEGFTKVAKSLGSINLNNQHFNDDIWKILALNTKYVDNYTVLNKITGEGLAKIITNAPEYLLETTIINICNKIKPVAGEGVNTEKYSKDYFDLLLCLSDSFLKRVGEENSKKYFPEINLPVDPKVILHLASLFHSQEKFHFGNYNMTSQNSSSIQDVFIKNIEKGLVSDVHTNSIITLFNSELQINWDKIADTINNRLLQNKLDEQEYSVLISMITFLRFNDVNRAQTHVSNLTKNGFFLGVLKYSANNELTAIIVLHNLIHYRKIENVRTQNNAPIFRNVSTEHKKFLQIFDSTDEYSELVENFANTICNYHQLPQLMKMITDNPNKNELLIKVFKKLLDEGYLRGLDINHVLNYYNGLNLDDEDKYVNIFFNLLDEEDLDVNKIDSLNKIKDEVLKASILSGSKLGSDLYNRCKNLFSNLSKEDWYKEIKNESHTLKLVRVLIELGRQSFINRVDFRDALLDYTEQVIFDNLRPKKFNSDEWSSLPKAMSKTNRESFYKILYTKLISDFRTSEISYNALSYYGDEFAKALNPKVRPDKFVENVLLDLINSNVGERLDWIIKNHTTLKRFLKNSKKETQSKIKDAINSKEGAEDIDSRVKRIQKDLELE